MPCLNQKRPHTSGQNTPQTAQQLATNLLDEILHNLHLAHEGLTQIDVDQAAIRSRLLGEDNPMEAAPNPPNVNIGGTIGEVLRLTDVLVGRIAALHSHAAALNRL